MLYNINPAVWGQSFWDVFYYIVIAYPDNPTLSDKMYVRNFFDATQYILPCENCRTHFSENLKKYPMTEQVMSSKYELLNWLVGINNEVNSRIGKQSVNADQMYAKYTAPKNKKIYWKSHMTIVLLVLLILLIVFYMKNRN